jgi:hypothetical protein
VEYLRELVVYEEGASSVLDLSQTAESNFKKRDVTQNISLSQLARSNYATLFVTSTLNLTQDEDREYVEVPYTLASLSLTQAASVTVWPGQHSENTLSLSQTATVSRIRNQSAETTIELSQSEHYVGPKWLDVETTISLDHSTRFPETIEQAVEHTIAFTQSTSIGGTRRLDVETPLVLDVYADNIVKVRRATTQIDLTQSTTVERVLTASNHITLAQDVWLGAVAKRAENQLTLDHEARFQPLPQFVETTIDLTQSVRQNIRNADASSQITLDHSDSVLRPVRVSGESELVEQDYVVDPDTGDVTLSDVGLRHEATVIRDGVESASHLLSFRQTVGLSHVRVGGTSLSATTTLSLSQSAHKNERGLGRSTINVTQLAKGWAGRPGDSVLELTDEALLTISHTFTGLSELGIVQAAAYSLIVSDTLYQYSPFIGESSDPDAPTPPPETLQEPLTGISAPFQLLYPATGVVTDSLSLRTPNLGNLDRLSFNRIQRETRGGTLVIYADPVWPKTQTLVLSFSGLRQEEARNLLTFIEDHLGQEIGLIDWEHRYWRGVITAPDQPIVQDGRDSYTASFEFQGEPDPTWTP